MPVHVIPDEGEIVRPNKNSKLSEFMHNKKGDNTETSVCNRVMNALNKLDTLYNPTMSGMNEPVIECNYKVTGYTRVITIVEQ